jgi:hypothetical protein
MYETLTALGQFFLERSQARPLTDLDLMLKTRVHENGNIRACLGLFWGRLDGVCNYCSLLRVRAIAESL